MLQAVADRVAYLRASTTAPADDGWVPCSVLCEPGPTLAELIATTGAGRGTDDPQVAASLFVQAYAFRIAGVALAAYALRMPWPDREPGRDGHPHRPPPAGSGGVPLGSARRAGAGRVGRRRARRPPPAAPRCRPPRGHGGRALAVGQRGRVLRRRLPSGGVGRRWRSPVRARAEAFFAAAEPWLGGLGRFTVVAVPPHDGWYWDRTSCCLWYQASGGSMLRRLQPARPDRPGGPATPSSSRRRARDLVRHQRRHGGPGPPDGRRGPPRGLRRRAGRAAVDPRRRRSTSTAPAACWCGCCVVAGRGRTASTALRADCVGAGHPASSPSPARPCPIAELTSLSTVPSAHRHRGLRLPGERRARELRAPPAVRRRHRAASRASASSRRGRSPTHGVWRAPAERHAGRPLVGVVFYRAHLVAGNTAVRRPTCATRIEAAGARHDRRVVLLAARRRRASRCSTCCARAGVDVADHHRAGDRRASAAARHRGRSRRARRRGLGRQRAGRARRADHPGARRRASRVAAVGGRPAPDSGRTTPRRASPSPSSTAASSARSSRSTRWSTTATSSASSVQAYRTVPDRVARVAGLAVRYARLRRTPPARPQAWRSCSAPTRPSAAGSATPSASTRRRRP